MSDEIINAADDETVTEEIPVVTDAPTAEETPPSTEEAPVVQEEAEAPVEEFLELSDEDFEKLEVTDPTVEEETSEEETTTPSTETPEGEAPETPAAGGSSEASAEGVSGEVNETKTETPVTEEGGKPSSVMEGAAAAKETPAAVGSPLEVDDKTAIAAYKEFFAPFKANGKTVQAKSKDEVIRLMQMGAGYTKTMMELKPQLTQVRTLKNNGIDDATLNYLIEIKNGNPDAIKKLVRESGIDPLDIETGDAGQAADASYRPKDYRASETQVEFEMAVAQVAGSDHGKAVLESVQREWDGQSREAAYKDPAILSVLTEQKASGIYDQISAQVEHERMLGHLKGVSYLDAYQQVGAIMANNGLLTANTAPAPATTVTETVTSTPAQQTATPGAEPKVLERKAAVPKQVPNNNAQAKAVAPVSSGLPAKALPANPMNMSDEDFAKLEGLEHLV